MHRGYVKFYRCAEDSRAWSRGMEFRGLLITLLARACYKDGFFLGRAVSRGQFGTTMETLAADLGVTRSKALRMLRLLTEDGFCSVHNEGNRFSIITIEHYDRYQSAPDACRTTGGPLADAGRTNGEPPSLQKRKKEKKKEGKQPSPREPEDSPADLREAVAGYAASGPLRAALEDFRRMRERLRKPLTGRALQLLFAELDRLAGADETLKTAVLEQSILHSWQSVYALRGAVRTAHGIGPGLMEKNRETAARVLAMREARRNGNEAPTA